ncbi:MAG: hypothetical protein KDB80_10665 [Planctomycetes bacterium]|nr:hypothetical protein [Planctomycetota bacterium]
MNGKSSSVVAFVVGLLVGVLAMFVFTSTPSSARLVGDASVREDEEVVGVSPHERSATKTSTTDVDPIADTAERRDVARPDAPDERLGVLVYGRIQDRSGEPVDAWLRFTPDNGDVVLGRTEAGSYTALGLRPGSAKLRVSGSDIISFEEQVDIEAVATQRLDVTVQRAHSVEVAIVTPAGEPIEAALRESELAHRVEIGAVATEVAPTGHLPMTDMRAHARFGIGRWEPARGLGRSGDNSLGPEVVGTLRFDLPPPIYASVVLRHRVLGTKIVEPGAKRVSFEISLDDLRANLTTIRCRVVDAMTLEPVATARVGISDRQSGGPGQPVGEDGRIVIEHQPSGLLELDAYAKGFEHYHQNLRLEPGENDLGDIRLGEARDVSIRVVDGNGEPASAVVRWTNLDRMTFPQPLNTGRTTSGDGDGLYKLWGVGAGNYVVTASSKDAGMGYARIDTRSIESNPLEIMLRPVVEWTVDAKTLATGQMRLVQVFDRQRTPVYGRYVREPAEWRTSLPAGDYEFEVHDGLRLVKSGPLRVSSGAMARIVVD